MVERDRETVVVTEGGSRGSGGTILAVVLLIAVLVVLFLLFGQDLLNGGSASPTDVNVDVSLPGTGGGSTK